LFLIKKLFGNDEVPKIYGIYPQPTPTFWPKYFFVKLLLGLQAIKRARSKEPFRGDFFRMQREDRAKHKDVELIEKKHKLPDGITFLWQ
jgi:hypothetical protein